MCSGTSKQSLAERKKKNFIFTAVNHIHNTYVWPSALGYRGDAQMGIETDQP